MDNIKNIIQQKLNWINKSNQSVMIGGSEINNFEPLTKEKKNIENIFNEFSLDIQKFREGTINEYSLFMNFKGFLHKLKTNYTEKNIDMDQFVNAKIIDILNNITNAITTDQNRYFFHAGRYEVLPIIMMTYLWTNDFCDNDKMLDFAKKNQFIKFVANNVKPRIQGSYSRELDEYNQFYGGGGLGELRIKKMIDDIGDDVTNADGRDSHSYFTQFNAQDTSSDTTKFENWSRLNSENKKALLIQEFDSFILTVSDEEFITKHKVPLRIEIGNFQFKNETESTIEESDNRVAYKEISMLLHPDKVKTANSTLFYTYIKDKLQ